MFTTTRDDYRRRHRLCAALGLVALVSASASGDALYSGLVAMRRGDCGRAIVHLRRIVKTVPQNGDAWRLLCGCAESLGLYAEALHAGSEANRLGVVEDDVWQAREQGIRAMRTLATGLAMARPQTLAAQERAGGLTVDAKLLGLPPQSAKPLNDFCRGPKRTGVTGRLFSRTGNDAHENAGL